uniref:Insulin receptor substrate 1 n=1 Tax=Parascaris univalens TaxID=6257 RepID=A0A915AB56_PARUN
MADAIETKSNGIAKAGLITGGFFPLKSKKVYYAVLKDRVLELYKSAKEEKNGKEPKYLFDLSTAFNVHMHYECTLKECLSVMLPDETFFMRPDSAETDLDDWFVQLVDKARQARATLLGRPVFKEEYFEVAWDVEMVKLPKLRKKSKSDEKMEDLVSKYDHLLGKKRLCMYPHSMVIVKRGVTASENAVPPLRNGEFTEFPVNAVSNFGKQEKYFFLRVGRCAPTGAGELWLSTESGECARSIYEKVSKICERESEKRRSQGSRLPSFTSRTLRSGAHRDRVHTQPHRPQTDNNISSSAGEAPRKISATSIASMFASPSASISGPIAFNARSSSFCASQSSSSKRIVPIVRKVIKEESTSTSLSDTRQNSSTDVVLFVGDRGKSGIVNEDQEESSGGTIMYIGDREGSERRDDGTPKLNRSVPKQLKGTSSMAGDYTMFDGGSGTSTLHDTLMSSLMHPTSFTMQIAVHPTKEAYEVPDGEYTQMECAAESIHLPVPISDQNFNLTEVRSYVSDSTESCHSGAFSSRSIPTAETSGDNQRAYSLGSRPVPQMVTPLSATRHLQNKVSNDVIDETVTKQFDDPRKRAHSLGSKSWMKPLRKSSTMRSGSECSDANGIRQRSDSFGSSSGTGSRAASFSAQKDVRKGGARLLSTTHDHTDDLTEWDFGGVGMGRSGSSSMASIESPSQSRTSSFGVSGAILLRSAVEQVMNRTEKNVERLRHEANNEKKEDMERMLIDEDNDEYVLSSFGVNEDEHRAAGTERSSASTSQRIIGTILEMNASSSSSRSASPKSLKALSIEDSLIRNEVNKRKYLEEEDGISKNLLTRHIAPSDVGDYVEGTAVCSSQVPRQSVDGAPQLDYACLALNVDSSRKPSANTIQSGILQVALPKFTCDYTIVDTQQP